MQFFSGYPNSIHFSKPLNLSPPSRSSSGNDSYKEYLLILHPNNKKTTPITLPESSPSLNPKSRPNKLNKQPLLIVLERTCCFHTFHKKNHHFARLYQGPVPRSNCSVSKEVGSQIYNLL